MKKEIDNSWNYFAKDKQYSTVLRDRLIESVDMDSASALGHYLNNYTNGNLSIIDFGSGPGHYYPIISKIYSKGEIKYIGIDIDEVNIEFGNKYFKEDANANFLVGSVLSPSNYLSSEVNCIISANTLPHVPTIEPLFEAIRKHISIDYFVFRMLIGVECVQIKKHLVEDSFQNLFEENYQYNNIYSIKYLESLLGKEWNVKIEDDIFNLDRVNKHEIPRQKKDEYYSNRVSRQVGGMIFKGEIYMPWKFVIGNRIKNK
jgi:SAM-dependent methyltransferase